MTPGRAMPTNPLAATQQRSCDVLAYADVETHFPTYFENNQPVVIRGVRDHVPDLRIFQWSASYFENVFSDQPVPIVETQTGFLSYERNTSSMPYSEFIAHSFGPDRAEDRYFYYKNSTDLLPRGHDDSDRLFALAPYLRRSRVRNLWISRDGLTVGLHFDPAENLNFQLRGWKKFTLYPPGTHGYYPMPLFSQAAHMSRVFREGPTLDTGRFPAFDPSQGRLVELREGDILYLPAYWWHEVQSLGGENVNLNFWWFPPARKQLRNWNQALRGYAQMGQRLARFGNLQKAPSAARHIDANPNPTS